MILNIFLYGLPKSVPKEMQRAIDKLKRTRNKQDCLNNAYKLLTTRFQGQMMYFLTHFPSLFLTNMDTIWNRTKTLNCNVMNYLMRVLLVGSGKFSNEEIKNKWTMVKGFSPHQYLQVKIGRKTVNIDIWGGTRGKPLGTYAH